LLGKPRNEETIWFLGYRSILQRIWNKEVWESELDSSGSGQGPVATSYEHGNEPSGYIQGEEFLNQMSDYRLLRKDSGPWDRSVS
jgi:hypothetical protein